MPPPATIASMNDVRKGKLAFFTPTFSTASLTSAGLYACRLKIGTCGADGGSAMLHSRFEAAPLLPGRAANGQQTDNLHRDHLHQSHRWEDHCIADVGPFGRSHLGRVDEDGRI